MSTFTSTLPDNLLKALSKRARELEIPKNKIIEKALTIYLDQLNRAEYVRSYKKMSGDPELLEMAEEGMSDYLRQLADK